MLGRRNILPMALASILASYPDDVPYGYHRSGGRASRNRKMTKRRWERKMAARAAKAVEQKRQWMRES